MKKALTLVLSLVLVLSLFVPATAESEYFYSGTTPIVAEPTTVTLLGSNAGSKMDDISEMRWIQEIIKRAGIDLQAELVPSSAYSDVLKPRLAAAVDLPDIIQVGNDATMTYASSGILYDISGLVEAIGYGMKYWTTQVGYENYIKDLTCPDGSMYYVNTIIANESRRAMSLNIPWAEAAGVDLSNVTVEALDAYFRYILENDMNGNGDATDEIPLFVKPAHVVGLATFWGLDLYSSYQLHEDGTVTCAYTDPMYKEYLTQLNKWYTDGILYNEYVTADEDILTNVLSNNRMGAILDYVNNLDSYSTRVNPEWRYGDPAIFDIVDVQPVAGNYLYYGTNYMSNVGGWALSAETQVAEAAFAFLDHLLLPETVMLREFGIEGEDYTIDENGFLTHCDEYMQNLDKWKFKQGENMNAFPKAKINANYYYENNNKSLTLDFLARHDRSKVLAPMPKFFMAAEDAETISMYGTDLGTYFEENRTAFITGARSLDEWDAYVAGAESLNLEAILAVYQKAA